MSTKAKIAIVVSVVALIAVLLFWIQRQSDELTKLKYKNGELVGQLELKDGTIRNMSSYASKSDIERLIKESGLNLKVIEKDLSNLDSEIKGVQKLVLESQGLIANNLKSSSTTKRDDDVNPVTPEIICPDGSVVECPDEFGYLSNRQIMELYEPFGGRNVPIGKVGFSAWQDRPWDVNIYPRKYSVTNILSVNDDGKTNLHSHVTIDSNGESITVPVYNANYVEQYPSAKFRFNPRIYFGVSAGFSPHNVTYRPVNNIGEIIPEASIFLFSRGKTRLDTDWAVLGLGLGYATQNRALAFTISPIYYNIGKPIPLIDNLLVGPTVGLDTNGNLSFLIGLKVGL